MVSVSGLQLGISQGLTEVRWTGMVVPEVLTASPVALAVTVEPRRPQMRAKKVGRPVRCTVRVLGLAEIAGDGGDLCGLSGDQVLRGGGGGLQVGDGTAGAGIGAYQVLYGSGAGQAKLAGSKSGDDEGAGSGKGPGVSRALGFSASHVEGDYVNGERGHAEQHNQRSRHQQHGDAAFATPVFE